ncbi:hypothetical protein Aple_054490 [Acrocarpospora pleiomorpha]|uniref:Uncharacterized protein n=1 Tax=Acrocarpospora pleiomorpha TaxID=90975 RepID=A0A5M3XSI9_9ACTN|nr:DUF4435 domain-containing protein [Acrocarpospora pleiomorpha]GES22551.1 hypothetical protein Aple_054490 [Acrocarpospora pleiomorpha]
MTLRQIAELVTLYELEPSLREIYTEGRTDSAIIREALLEAGLNIPVYAVSDRVEVPPDLMEELDLSWGNRNIVIALAHALSEIPQIAERIACIIDDDFDTAFEEKIVEYPCLLRTDYASIEAYCFNEAVLGKFLRVTLRAPIDIDAQSVLDALADPLETLFRVRYILYNCPEATPLIGKLEKRCTIYGGDITVDHFKLIRDSLSANTRVSNQPDTQRAAFMAYGELRKDETLDRRHLISDHDFPAMLSIYISAFCPQLFRDDRKDFKNPRTAMAALYGCLDLSKLLHEPLFSRLIQRFS